MKYLTLLISICLGTSKNIVSKAGNHIFSDLANILQTNVITAVFGLIIFGISGINHMIFSNTTLIILALLYGLFTMLSQMLYIDAVELSPVSVCSLIYSCGFLIPTLFAVLFFKEGFSLFQLVGVAILVLSIFLVTGNIQSSKNFKGILLALLAMVCSGCVGVLQKLFTTVDFAFELNDFLFLSFMFMLIISLFLKAFISENRKNDIKIKINFTNAFYPVALSLSVVFGNKLNLYLSGVIPGIIFFPCVNGGCIALTTLSSKILFKEKLTTIQWFGILGSIIAITLIAMK
jgi:drug/metabolite transporter (DMT)-like permease